MGKKQYIWQPGDPPPPIEPHSVAKHEVLSAYLRRYIEVLTVDPRLDVFRLTLVDGFAGGGLYTDALTGDERLGSPLLMLEAMHDAEASAKAKRRKEFNLDIRYIFVDRRQHHLDFLKAVIETRDFAGRSADKVDFIKGKFKTHCPEILKRLTRRGKCRRVIFLLDQYGYSHVPMPTLRAIFSTLDNAEVILTFAADWLIDFLSSSERSAKIFGNLGLSLPGMSAEEAKQSEGTEWRGIIQHGLHSDVHLKSGAKYYTPFFIESTKSHRAYWLIHLSNHPTARDVMTTLHWIKHNYFVHYGGPGLNMLGFTPKKDFKDQLVFGFDDAAKTRTEDALKEQLPKRIAGYDGGVKFAQLLSDITNETPATRVIIEETIRFLTMQGELRLLSAKKRERAKGSCPIDTDIVLYDSRPRLFTL